MIPLLLCAYRPRYLEHVLYWLRKGRVEEKYRIMIWDNGGAESMCAREGFTCYSWRPGGAGEPQNVGKAFAMRQLVDIANKTLPDAACYVCMDDDVVVDRDHLDALVAATQRPNIGMVGAHFHPFHTVMPPGGSIVEFDPCPDCLGAGNVPACSRCGGSGKDPRGLRLRTYPAEDRTVRKTGRVAGTLFAVSKAAVAKLRWKPYLYPVLTRPHDDRPVVYWAEDQVLDMGLTALGFTNGYLEVTGLTPAIHLPELNVEYMQWKLKARAKPPDDEFRF
jgi:hypothetical protein